MNDTRDRRDDGRRESVAFLLRPAELGVQERGGLLVCRQVGVRCTRGIEDRLDEFLVAHVAYHDAQLARLAEILDRALRSRESLGARIGTLDLSRSAGLVERRRLEEEVEFGRTVCDVEDRDEHVFFPGQLVGCFGWCAPGVDARGGAARREEQVAHDGFADRAEAAGDEDMPSVSTGKGDGVVCVVGGG